MSATRPATARGEGERIGAQTPFTERAVFEDPRNTFEFRWPPVPRHQFLAERDRAFDPATPTEAIALDISSVLGTAYAATTPTLLCRYLRIRPGETLSTHLMASGEMHYVLQGSGASTSGGDRIAWQAGDVFCFPGGQETVHRAGEAPCLLFTTTNEPLLALERLQPPPPGEAVLETVHYRAEAIRERLEAVWARERGPTDAGQAVQLTSRALRPSRNTFPTVNAAFNSLDPGADQRAHRHNGVAVTLAIECEDVYSLIEGQRIDWSPGAAQITPGAELHSHHNRGSTRMLSLVVQDEGLHYYTRTPGFSWT